MHNPFGGFAPGAERCLRMLSKLSIDTTVYENWAAADYRTYWGQRISATRAPSSSPTPSAASRGSTRYVAAHVPPTSPRRSVARARMPRPTPAAPKRPALSTHAARDRAR